MTVRDHAAVIGADDPAPVVRINPAAASPFLLIGDHAGIAIPRALGTLGLGPGDLARHIACDIGIAALGTALAAALDATFLAQAYSRLVIDCNRDPASAEAIPEVSDGTAIPGNRGLSARARDERVARIHAPYQQAIADEIAGRRPVLLVSLHSFTPVMAGIARPWHVGVLHDGARDAFAKAMLAALRAEDGIVVGDNAPYRMDATDHTVPRHAFAAGLPYVELEVRQDLLAGAAGIAQWSVRLAAALTAARRALPDQPGGLPGQ